MTLTEAVIECLNKVKGLSLSLKPIKVDVDNLKKLNPENPNLAKDHPLRHLSAEPGVRIVNEGGNIYNVTAQYHQWIRTTPLDYKKKGQYTFTLVTNHKVERVAFHADTHYMECKWQTYGELKIFTLTFDCEFIKGHLNIQANNGIIYDYKLEEGGKSTLSQARLNKAMISYMMARMKRLERRAISETYEYNG